MPVMTTDEATLATVAAEAREWFEHVQRPGATEPDDRFWRTRDGSPEWVGDLVREAHGDFLPDDWRYATIVAALDYLADGDGDPDDAGEFADSQVDVYTSARLAWLSSNLNRAGYCDDAASEFGGADGIVAMIGLGQYTEAVEVIGLVAAALRARADQ